MAADKLARVKDALKSFPDFPKPGILFRDIFPLFRDPSVFNDLIDLLYDTIKESSPGVQCIVGLESRGFLFGPLLAQKLGVPFVPIRKKGKLPGDLVSVTYDLEYGSDTFEAQKGSILSGQKVVIIDDLLATGGTMKAACDLVEQLGAKVDLCLVVIELADLEGRKKIPKPLKTLITF
ncbi:unnamed protein product [Candidula unifasciata]|uniref:Adenine phosphoribosyltransferase n=1 Tax=Candidula unifasciata TaxID=100452 RepID=A0A8S3YW11_9EUPU|nr:unnamed protein product [Candidula unifasciata]